MIFTYDTELTLRAACVLVNGGRVDGEQLGDMASLDEYLDGFGWTGRRDRDTAELESVHRLRDRIGRIWAVADDEERAVGQVNALLSDTRAAPWLTDTRRCLNGTCTWRRSTTRCGSAWVRRWRWHWPTSSAPASPPAQDLCRAGL